MAGQRPQEIPLERAVFTRSNARKSERESYTQETQNFTFQAAGACFPLQGPFPGRDENSWSPRVRRG